MIDDSVLVQVYSTVLVGVLIFLTLESKFESGGVGEQAKSIEKEITSQQRNLDYLKADKERVIREKDYKRDSKIVSPDHFENRIKNIDKDLETGKNKMNALQSNFNKLKEEHSHEIEEYNDRKSITLTMIVFLVMSIISLLVGSIFDQPHIPDILTPLVKIASFVFFSIAVALLVSRVYLHSR